MGKKKTPPHKLNWYARVFIFDMVTFPAYRHLSKSQTDVLTVALAKSDAAAAEKDRLPGRPVFPFPFSEAKRTLGMNPQSFQNAIDGLKTMGFICVVRPGGTANGDGIPNLYQLQDGWKTWTPPLKNTANIEKARAAKKARIGATAHTT
ncbi:hypothetical protein [Geomonas agri]|uniref:hypothetical protein n=1 Tax=Geomonas agri TaxID=2873702 RepID=UPI001CD3F4FB|nr:hypothetical protein [Geomonas agri]